MNTRPILKIIGYGILLWVSLNIVLFVASLMFGSDEKAPPPVGFAIVAMVMVFVSYAFGRRYKPVSRKQAGISGLVWSGTTIVFMLVTAVANGTQGIFSNWGVYLVLIAPAVGPMFVSVNKTDIGNPSPTM